MQDRRHGKKRNCEGCSKVGISMQGGEVVCFAGKRQESIPSMIAEMKLKGAWRRRRGKDQTKLTSSPTLVKKLQRCVQKAKCSDQGRQDVIHDYTRHALLQ